MLRTSFLLTVFLSSVLLGCYDPKQMFEEANKDLRQAKVEAEKWAKTHDQKQSVTEALRRGAKCEIMTDNLCLIKVQTFLSHSLRSAKPSKNFCEGVPERIKYEEVAVWLESKCATGTVKDGRCEVIFAAVPQFCSEKTSR